MMRVLSQMYIGVEDVERKMALGGGKGVYIPFDEA